MGYRNNEFCWFGVASSDPERTASFLQEVVGWTTVRELLGGEEVTKFAVGDVHVAHLNSMERFPDGTLPHISCFLRVSDVDSVTDAARAHGGSVRMPPVEIPTGRVSTVASPSGGVFHLFHERDESTVENAPDVAGTVCWVELHSQDADADLDWMKAVLGVSADYMQTGDGPYFVVMSGEGEHALGGVLRSPCEDVPSNWMVWVATDDVDAAAARATAAGGTLQMGPMDVPEVGRLVGVMDPCGVHFGLVTRHSAA